MSSKMKSRADASGYNIEVTGRHVAVTEAMKQYAVDKISKIEHFSDRILDVHVTMDIQKLDHRVAIVMKVGHYMIKVQANSPDMYASLDKAVDKLLRKLLRYKDKLKEHQGKPISVVDMNVNVYRRPLRESDVEEINDAIEDETRRRQEREWTPHKVVKVDKHPLKTLTLEEAMLKMELSDDTFLVYRSEEDSGIRVIYRRGDGDYGVFQPE